MNQDFAPEVTAVLDGVRDLLPTIRERAEEGERLRVIPDASDRKSTRLNSSHIPLSRMPSSA